MAELTPERLSKLSGIPVEEIREMMREWAQQFPEVAKLRRYLEIDQGGRCESIGEAIEYAKAKGGGYLE